MGKVTKMKPSTWVWAGRFGVFWGLEGVWEGLGGDSDRESVEFTGAIGASQQRDCINPTK